MEQSLDGKGVVPLLNRGALEFHIWGNPQEDMRLPWEDVIEASFRIRKLLKDIKLDSFVEARGGKGLHVIVPVERKSTWKEVKRFARDVASGLQGDYPSLYVETSSAKCRTRVPTRFVNKRNLGE